MTRSEMSLGLAAVLAAVLAAFLFFATPAYAAGSPQLVLPDFNHLKGKATESVDVTIDGFVLRIAKKFASNEAQNTADPEERAALDLLNDIHSIQVRNFEFADDDAYSKDDIDGVRRQLTGPNWNAIVQKRSRDHSEDVDVFLNTDGERILGIAVIASQPRSFTIVNISGNIDVDKLTKLEGKFDIPHLSMAD